MVFCGGVYILGTGHKSRDPSLLLVLLFVRSRTIIVIMISVAMITQMTSLSYQNTVSNCYVEIKYAKQSLVKISFLKQIGYFLNVLKRRPKLAEFRKLGSFYLH